MVVNVNICCSVELVTEREQAKIELCKKLKYNAAMYVYRDMKKLGEHGCVLAAYRFW